MRRAPVREEIQMKGSKVDSVNFFPDYRYVMVAQFKNVGQLVNLKTRHFLVFFSFFFHGLDLVLNHGKVYFF